MPMGGGGRGNSTSLRVSRVKSGMPCGGGSRSLMRSAAVRTFSAHSTRAPSPLSAATRAARISAPRASSLAMKSAHSVFVLSFCSLRCHMASARCGVVGTARCHVPMRRPLSATGSFIARRRFTARRVYSYIGSSPRACAKHQAVRVPAALAALSSELLVKILCGIRNTGTAKMACAYASLV